jgi:hypothetical protein
MAEFHAQRKLKIPPADENANRMIHNLLDFIHFQIRRRIRRRSPLQRPPYATLAAKI